MNNNIKHEDICNEMEKSYIDYAMSVIASRALPDVRDGLKPVHRRILYAMNELGLSPDKPFRKSARIVGDVLGKYHPHGDSSVYEAMVRLAQDFATRYLLVNGHGNFGSIDGDSAAAMRYTEAKMTPLAMVMLEDIEKNTVKMNLNFDETMEEPSVLPSRFPNLLVNGTNGIAVGFASSIPPHQLGEVIDAVVYTIDNEDASTDDLMQFIKGPDFPTGAKIVNPAELKAAYETGRGRAVIRSDAEIVPMSNGKHQIIFTSIPYQVNKADMITKIAELVRNKKIDKITDIRDESNREGIRIVVEVSRDGSPNIVLNQLYKYTQLQDSFHFNMIALVNGEPVLLNLKSIIQHYINHQKEIITKRTEYDLNKAKDRMHILDGLKIALSDIDEVVKTIKASTDTKDAKDKLMSKYSFSEVQATAILDMKLQKLTSLEIQKIEEEINELITKINFWQTILNDKTVLKDVLKEELTKIKAKYNDKRKTQIVFDNDFIDTKNLNKKDFIQKEKVIISLTDSGYIKCMPDDSLSVQNRGGKGVNGHTTKEEDFVKHILPATTHDKLLCFSNKGKVYVLDVYEIPISSRIAKGSHITNLLEMQKDEYLTEILPYENISDSKSSIVMATKYGIIKRTNTSSFENVRKNGIKAIELDDGDRLQSAEFASDNDMIMIITRQGMSIKFSISDNIREIGRTSRGVRALKLKNDDYVINARIIKDENSKALIVSEKGFGKLTDINLFKTQSRGGSGTKAYNVSSKGLIAGFEIIENEENDEIAITNNNNIVIRIKACDISTVGRTASGVKIMKLSNEEKIIAITKI